MASKPDRNMWDDSYPSSLIAVSTRDRLPELDGWYFCMSIPNGEGVAWYSAKEGSWKFKHGGRTYANERKMLCWYDVVE